MPAFTRRREIFVGRIAMVGFFAACAWETFLTNHPSIMRQVSMGTGLDVGTVVGATRAAACDHCWTELAACRCCLYLQRVA
jgi:hypothetical protein